MPLKKEKWTSNWLTVYSINSRIVQTCRSPFFGSVWYSTLQPMFFGTYMLHDRTIKPNGSPRLHAAFIDFKQASTPFQGMHYGNTSGVLACLRPFRLWFKTCTTVMSMSWRMVIILLLCTRLVGLNKVAPCLLCFFPFFFFWWGLLHGPQQGPDRMKEKTYKTGKRKTPA